MPESVQSCFELSIHFPVFFPANYGLVAVHGWFAMEINVWMYLGLKNLKIITYSNFHNRKPRLHFFCSHDRVVVIPRRRDLTLVSL